MPEQVQKVLDRILEWWKKFNTKQKTLLISIVAVVLVALAILAAVVSKPKMVTLVTCETTAESGQVKNILDSENISYELSADGLAFQVNEKDYANASIVLGTNDIPTSGTKLSDVFDGGLGILIVFKYMDFIIKNINYISKSIMLRSLRHYRM